MAHVHVPLNHRDNAGKSTRTADQGVPRDGEKDLEHTQSPVRRTGSPTAAVVVRYCTMRTRAAADSSRRAKTCSSLPWSRPSTEGAVDDR
ncbi:hypothetical protein ABIA33_004692 [Streptacidiphilus sp. MAP12-16]|jgi:hypothetical protein|uniref:hypothetical protein n=1 Tax=Streptacidiphilus sp. MAP12-16 TaxID=3156300 RepID=UPI00351215DE